MIKQGRCWIHSDFLYLKTFDGIFGLQLFLSYRLIFFLIFLQLATAQLWIDKECYRIMNTCAYLNISNACIRKYAWRLHKKIWWTHNWSINQKSNQYIYKQPVLNNSRDLRLNISYSLILCDTSQSNILLITLRATAVLISSRAFSSDL